MKKFIATLLSALVGVFGYTLTDSVVEDRISRLETEIVELREQIAESNQSEDKFESLKIGDYIKVGSASFNKFLLRENENGVLEFIHPSKFDQTKSDDVYVYLTDVICQVTEIENTSLYLEKGKNYEPASLGIAKPLITIKFKGYVSQNITEKNISFSVGAGSSSNYFGNYIPDIPLSSKSVSNNIVFSDRSFEYEAVYELDLERIYTSELNLIYYGYGSSYFSDYLPQIIKQDLDTFGISVYSVALT